MHCHHKNINLLIYGKFVNLLLLPCPRSSIRWQKKKLFFLLHFSFQLFLLTATRELFHTRLTLPFSNCNLLWPDFSLCSNQTTFHMTALWTNHQIPLNLKSFTMAGWATSAPTMLLSYTVGTSLNSSILKHSLSISISR